MDCVNCGYPCDGTSEFCSCICADEFYQCESPRLEEYEPVRTTEEEAIQEYTAQRAMEVYFRRSPVGSSVLRRK